MKTSILNWFHQLHNIITYVTILLDTHRMHYDALVIDTMKKEVMVTARYSNWSIVVDP